MIQWQAAMLPRRTKLELNVSGDSNVPAAGKGVELNGLTLQRPIRTERVAIGQFRGPMPGEGGAGRARGKADPPTAGAAGPLLAPPPPG